MYHLCLSVPGGVVSHLLQLLGKLLSVSLPRFSTARLRTRPEYCGHLDWIFRTPNDILTQTLGDLNLDCEWENPSGMLGNFCSLYPC